MWLDAIVMKCREGGRIVNTCCVIAAAVNCEGHREVLGLDIVTSEDGAGWASLALADAAVSASARQTIAATDFIRCPLDSTCNCAIIGAERLSLSRSESVTGWGFSVQLTYNKLSITGLCELASV